MPESKERLRCAARAGTAHGFVSEELECAGDELAVETLADDDGRAGATEIKRAGQHALMPETEDLGAGAHTKGKRRGTQLGDGLKAPGAAHDGKQGPNKARDKSQQEALAERELIFPRPPIRVLGHPFS